LTPALANNPAAVQQRLLAHAQKRVNFYAGERYSEVVASFLSGKWTDGTPVVEVFGKAVEILDLIGKEL
jgi:hypothetical protein